MWHGHIWGLGWGGVITVVILAVRALSGRGRGVAGDEYTAALRDPPEIIKARYARGEFDPEQYLEMRRDLKV